MASPRAMRALDPLASSRLRKAGTPSPARVPPPHSVLQLRTKMKALVVYDSLYGNTEKVAKAIADAVGGEAKPVGEVDPSKLNSLDLLIVGSPTHRGRSSTKMHQFLNTVPARALKNVEVAAFDTRNEITGRGIGARLLRAVAPFAAPRIAKALKSKGGKLIAKPEGFIVEAREGPLKEGELSRSSTWARGIMGSEV